MIQHFELSPEQLKIKGLLSNKNFISIEIYAISDDNPNNNGSHFTLTGMEEGKSTFIDKPILGFFNKSGDFESHNGKVGYDPELQQNYWDNSNGEQILGVIRESDTVQIVNYNGKNWIKCTAILYTQYNYKQIRRLLKDRKKKVSVEVNILESETIEGVLYIYKFELIGITILGSRQGVPVKEGIEGAHLSVLDLMEEDIFNNQKQAVVFAYQQIDQEGNEETDQELIQNQKKDKGDFAMDNQAFEELKQQNEELSKTCSEQAAKCSELEAQSAEQECKYQELECKYQELECKYNELNENFASVKENLEQSEARCSELMAQIENCKDYETIKSEFEALKETVKQKNIAEVTRYAKQLASQYQLNEEVMADVYERCQNESLKTQIDIDKEVAYIVFNLRKSAFSEGEERFQTNIVTQAQPSSDKEGWRDILKKNSKKS